MDLKYKYILQKNSLIWMTKSILDTVQCIQYDVIDARDHQFSCNMELPLQIERFNFWITTLRCSHPDNISLKIHHEKVYNWIISLVLLEAVHLNATNPINIDRFCNKLSIVNRGTKNSISR